MHFHALDVRLLSRAGTVLQALVRWFASNPADRHPTVDQLAAESGTNRKFVQRGLKDLAAAGLILFIPDPAHPVNRMIDLAAEVAPLVAAAIVAGVAAAVTPDTSGGTQSGPRDASGVTEVAALRSSKLPEEVQSLKLGQDTFGTGGTPTPGPMADVMQRLANRITRDIGQQIGEENQARDRARLADFGHLERQGRLPLTGIKPDPSRKLLTVVGDLERAGPEAIAAVEPVVAKLCEQFGSNFEGLYRKVSQAVALGRFTIAPLVETIEEASHPRVKHPGPAFAAASLRRFPGLFVKEKRPAAGIVRQDSPDGRPGVAEASIQFNRVSS